MLKILIFGSSFVNHLEKFDKTKDKIHTVAGFSAQFIYKGYRGHSFDLFLDKPAILDEILQCCPDYVFVLLGSNSITTRVNEASILDQARDFYKLFTDKLQVLNPNAVLVASQLPLRFVEDTNNIHCTPPPEEYKRIRDKVNQKIKRLECIKNQHYMLLIAGKGRLDSKEYFGKDGVHFNHQGKELQLKLIKDTLAYILKKNKSNLPVV